MTETDEPNIKASLLAPKTLAYLGDAVYELLIREYCIGMGAQQANKLHKKVTGFVRADFQADLLNHLEPGLSEEEADWVRRGKNLSLPQGRKLDVNTYRHATGFELLIGYLYLTNKERLNEIQSDVLAYINSQSC